MPLDDVLYGYLLDHSLRESALLLKLREVTATLEMSQMQIAPEQGQFMSLLVQLIGAERIIEVGVFTGYSALCMAQAMPEHGQLLCCDVNREWTDIAGSFWREAGVEGRIDLHIAPAMETLDNLIRQDKSGDFDMVFIDADKTHYMGYYERCLKLVRHGGLLLFDNTLWGGKVADTDNRDDDTLALRVFNKKLYKDERVDISLVPIGDGLTLARKR